VRIHGTATVTIGNTVEIHLGNDPTGPYQRADRQPVDPLGAWSFRIANGPQPTAP
jgi:hypothetical protein